MSDYANIREILGSLIGKKLLDVSQHDEEEFNAGKDSFVELMFEDGCTLRFFALNGDHYKAGYPFCFSDPSIDFDRHYHPTEEEKAAGNWAVVDANTEDGPVGHVVPLRGKDHILDDDCWCKPAGEERDDGSWFWTHNEDPEAT